MSSTRTRSSPAMTQPLTPSKRRKVDIRTPSPSTSQQKGWLQQAISPFKKQGAAARPESPKKKGGDIDSNKSGRALFGGKSSPISVPPRVRHVYSVVNKSTGALGGNGSFGAIYGELSQGSMQRVVSVLREVADLSATSRFIDVGSGLGKPSLHVSQDPGCQLSFGIELELVRWQLGVHNHRSLLLADPPADGTKPHNVYFLHGDMQDAKTFDPFTHVYMFDIGFPPSTLEVLAKAFNCSRTEYLISYQNPRRVMETYGFDVELIHKEGSLQLTGSSENHTMYVFRRAAADSMPRKTLNFDDEPVDDLSSKHDWKRHVDRLFKEGVELTCKNDGGKALTKKVEADFQSFVGSERQLRSRSP